MNFFFRAWALICRPLFLYCFNLAVNPQVNARCNLEWQLFRTRLADAEKAYYLEKGITPPNSTRWKYPLVHMNALVVASHIIRESASVTMLLLGATLVHETSQGISMVSFQQMWGLAFFFWKEEKDFFFDATGGVQDSYWIYIKTEEKVFTTRSSGNEKRKNENPKWNQDQPK